MIRCTIAAAAALAVTGLALAKLPPVDEAAKAKAAEAAAKTAWQGKVDAYQLCKVQDKVAAAYRKTATAAGKPASAGVAAAVPAANAPANAAAAGAIAAAAKPASGAAAPAAVAAASASAKPPTPTDATASQGGSTPVAGVGTAAAPSWPGCADPGPFAYAPPEQKPLETSGAHSPAANATSPPSNRATSAELAPSKPGTATAPAAAPAKKP
ncbi:hypothetical protein [Ramlibacter paludis]|uniref:hypothetical protein n=1 Tax=Ramlibacter paludis TaxID=2908000 RepID=UPI003211B655